MSTVAGKATIPFSGDYSALQDGAASAVGNIGAMFAKLIPVALAGSVAAAVGLIADLGEKYQAETDLMASAANITVAKATQIGSAFLATGGQWTYSAQTMMDALDPVAGKLELISGTALTTATSMTFMDAAMALAEATGEPLAGTVMALADVMQTYGINVAGAAAASDILDNVSSLLGVSVGDVATMVDNLRTHLGPLAPSLSDTATLLLDVADHGVTGSRGLLLVSGASNTLLGGSKATTGAIKDLGLSIYTASGQFVGWGSVIDQLQGKLAGMTQAQQLFYLKALLGSSASKALDDTIMAGLPGWDAAADAVGKTGTAVSGSQTATDNFKGAWDRLTSGVADFLTKAGLELMPMLTTIVKWVTGSVLPALGQFASWFTTDAVPAIESFGSLVVTWFTNTALPAIEGVVNYIATDVLPGLENLGSWITIWVVPPLETMGGYLATAVGDLAGFLANSGLLLPILGTLVGIWVAWNLALAASAVIGTLGTAVQIFGWAAAGASVGVGALTVSSWGLAAGVIAVSWPILAIIAGIALLAGGLVLLITHWTQVTNFLHGPWGTAVSIAVAVLAPFIGIPMLIIGHWKQIVGFLSGVWSDIVGVFKVAMGIITPIVDVALTVMSVAWSVFSTTVKIIVQAIWDTIAQIFKIGVGVVELIVFAVGVALQTVWNNIKGVVVPIVQGIATAISWAFSVMATALGLIWSGISSAVSLAWNIISGIVTGIVTPMVSTITSTIGGIVSALATTWATVELDVTAAWDIIVADIKVAVNDIIDIIDAIISGMNKVTGAIPFVGKSSRDPADPAVESCRRSRHLADDLRRRRGGTGGSAQPSSVPRDAARYGSSGCGRRWWRLPAEQRVRPQRWG